MQDIYQENYAICKYSDLDAASIMRGIATETIETMLRAMGIELDPELPKDSYLPAFLDEFTENGDWILKILPVEALDFLLDIWDQMEYGERDPEGSSGVCVDDEEWECLQYLKLFGLVTYKKGNSFANEANIVYIVKEMKDAFYFHLRSKHSQRLMEEYDNWETIIRGFMCYYGIIEVEQLYHMFIEAVPACQLTQKEFLVFLRVRSMLWNFGTFMRDTNSDIDYYIMYEVENPNHILKKTLKLKNMNYRTVETDDLIYVSEAAGIDNRWEGITTIGTFLIDELNMDYYRATVFVRTMISMIQNGYHLRELKENALAITAETEIPPHKIYEGIEEMYNSVPVFELKGHSRREYNQLRESWAEEKRKQQFRVIKGGD